MVFGKCRDVLLKETELVQRIAGLQDVIRDAVVNRDWTDFESHFSTLNEMREEFAALETERERLFAGIKAGPDGQSGFYAFTASLPAVQRSEITEIYRSLKFEAMKVQVSNQALMGYIAGVRATMAGFFEIAFPERGGGKIYTPHGVPVSRDMRSMVLNQSF